MKNCDCGKHHPNMISGCYQPIDTRGLAAALNAASAARAAIVEGSVVRLKSGGPKMTVEEIRADGVADTIRFVGSEESGWEVERHAFVAAALELAAD